MQNLVAANDNFPAIIDPLLPLRAVRAATGQGSSTIYRKMAIGAFPRALQIEPRSAAIHFTAFDNSKISQRS